MNDFIIGFLSSLGASLAIYMSRFVWAPAINWVFSAIYPNVSGRYRLIILTDVENVPDHIDDVDEIDLSSVEEDNLPIKRFITIRQLANYLRGTVETTMPDGSVIKDNFSGRITPTRLIVISYASETREHHDYGAGLYRLSPSGHEMKGQYMFLCSCCEAASAVKSFLRKTKS